MFDGSKQKVGQGNPLGLHLASTLLHQVKPGCQCLLGEPVDVDRRGAVHLVILRSLLEHYWYWHTRHVGCLLLVQALLVQTSELFQRSPFPSVKYEEEFEVHRQRQS